MTIDTLEYVKRLEAAGVDRQRAEADALAMRDTVAPQLVTKADLDAAVAQLDAKIDPAVARLEGKLQLVQWMLAFNLATTVAAQWRLLR